MVTGRGFGLLVGAAGLWLVGRAVGIRELYVLAVAAAVLVVAAAASVAFASATLSVRRTVPTPRLLWGGRGEVMLTLRNDAVLPTALLLVSDHRAVGLADGDGGGDPRWVVPGIGAGRQITLNYTVIGTARGRHRVGPLTVRVRDPFAVVQRVRRFQATDELLVYPRVEPLGAGLDPGRHPGSGSSEARRLLNAGDEFHTLRQYTTGDDLRQVHWPSSARRGSLMVRQTEQPWQAQATLFCDLRGEAGLERVLSAAASLVWHLADRDVALRLVTDADSPPPPVQGWDVILDRLALATPTAQPALAPALLGLQRGGEGGLFVALLTPPPGSEPLNRHPEVRALLAAARAHSPRVAVVVAGSGRPGSRAAELTALLSGLGWMATTVPPGGGLAERWDALVQTRPSRARSAAAVRPGASG